MIDTKHKSAVWHYTPNCRIPAGKSLPKGFIRYAAVVAYDGNSFCGFQRQKHSPSVQQQLEEALSYVANEPVLVSCAGRTDTGVHASHQVIHFDSSADRSAYNWMMGANSRLPYSVSISWVSDMADSFHARFSATTRTYRYVICAQKTRPAILAKGITWVRQKLDVELMNQACQHLLGEQDFTAFRGSGCQSVSAFRNVHSAEVYHSGQLIVFEITANAFLLHMVRNIVGSLLTVGSGRKPPNWIAELITQADRSKSAPTASPSGLYLVNVSYPIHFKLPESVEGPVFISRKEERV